MYICTHSCLNDSPSGPNLLNPLGLTSEPEHKTTKVELTHPHVGITVEWGGAASEGSSWAEVEGWEGRQSMSDREEEDHFMGC